MGAGTFHPATFLHLLTRHLAVRADVGEQLLVARGTRGDGRDHSRNLRRRSARTRGRRGHLRRLRRGDRGALHPPNVRLRSDGGSPRLGTSGVGRPRCGAPRPPVGVAGHALHAPALSLRHRPGNDLHLRRAREDQPRPGVPVDLGNLHGALPEGGLGQRTSRVQGAAPLPPGRSRGRGRGRDAGLVTGVGGCAVGVPTPSPDGPASKHALPEGMALACALGHGGYGGTAGCRRPAATRDRT
jgi:hypothetical protein